jgi:hypothetical protein
MLENYRVAEYLVASRVVLIEYDLKRGFVVTTSKTHGQLNCGWASQAQSFLFSSLY